MKIADSYYQLMQPAVSSINTLAEPLLFAGFKQTQSSPQRITLQNQWYTACIESSIVRWAKNRPGHRYSKATPICDGLLDMLAQIDYGTHYIYVGGLAICPLQKFGDFNTEAKLLELFNFLCDNSAELVYRSDKVFRWRLKNGKEVEIKQSSSTGYNATTETEEETTMDIFDALAADSLYTVKVVFGSLQDKEYSYKSEVAYEAGTKVVVETPNSGLQVVTVTSSEKGLTGGNFAKYKWVVAPVDTSRYNELMVNESKAKATIAAAKVKAELAALGVSESEILSMLGLASKAD